MSDPIKQGELYKLLWPTFESETYNDETRKRASDELNKVLDAARTDFPKIEIKHYGRQYPTDPQDDSYETVEAAKWFKKWLGAP